MALQKQKIPVPFSTGLDTKSDSKQLQIGKLVTAENVVFDNPGKLQKSKGYEEISNYALTGEKLDNLHSLSSYKNELLALTDTELYARSENINKWILKGKVVDVNAVSSVVVKNSMTQEAIDCIFLENTKVFAYTDTEGIKYSVIDHLNGTTLIHDSLISSTGLKPRLAKTGSIVIIFYTEGTNILYRTFNVTNPSEISDATTVVEDLATNNNYDVASTSNNYVTVVYNSSGDVLKVFQISPAFVKSTVVTKTGESGAGTIDVNVSSTEKIIVSYFDNSNVKVFMFSSNFGNDIISPTTVETISGVINVTSQLKNDTVTVYYEIENYETSGSMDLVSATASTEGGSGGAPRSYNNSTVHSIGDMFIIDNSHPNRFYDKVTFHVEEAAANPTNTVLVDMVYTEDSSSNAIWNITITPNDGTNNSGVPVSISTADLCPVVRFGPYASNITRTVTGYTYGGGSTQSLPLPYETYQRRIAADYYNQTLAVNGGCLDGYTFIMDEGVSTTHTGEAYGALCAGITYTYRTAGPDANGYTVKTIVNSPAANPLDTVLVDFSGSASDIVITITPNDGTNNSSIPVSISSAELVSLINNGTVSGKTVTLSGTTTLRTKIKAAGGDKSLATHRGCLDQCIATFSGGSESATPIGQTVGLVDEITYLSTVAGEERNSTTVTTQVNAAASNPDNNVIVTVTGSTDAIIITITPNSSPANYITTAELVTLINNKAFTGVTLNDSNLLLNAITATGGGSTSMINGGEGDNVTVVLDGGAVPGEDYNNHYIRQNTITTGSVLGTASDFLRSVCLAGKAVNVNDNTYLPIMHVSELQSTNFLADESGSIILSISPNNAGTIIANNQLPHVPSIDDNTILLPSQIKGRTITDYGVFDSLLGVNSSVITFDTPLSTGSKILVDNLHLASGILYAYDGFQVTEHGFFLYPEDLTFETETANGFMSDGTYQYTALYNWTDVQGKQHLSASAVPIEVVLDGGTDAQLVTIKVPTLRITSKENVTIDVYRTEASGTIFYKVTSVDSPVMNDKTTDYVSVSDGLTDDDLIDNETLYTTGGVLDNIVAPQASIIESSKDRIFLAGLEDVNKIQYSKIVSEGKPVEFNDTLTTLVNPFGGAITSLKVMDDKLIIFKESAIYYMSGDGPNNLGEQDSFITPELISSDMGCVNRDSIALTAQGLFFQSKKGIYLLGRDLSISYIGAPVEKYNSLTITSADVINDKNQVRFATEEGTCLVYNYFVNQWATYTNQPSLDAAIVNYKYYYLRPESAIYLENDTYSNNGTDIKMKIETGWINFAGVQGLQRVYRLLLLGEFKSDHKLRIKVAYDYKDVYTQEATVDSTDFIDSTAFGGYSPYGSESTYGTTGNLYQIRLDMAQQRCQAIKLSIEDITDDCTEGMSLSTISFLVGTLASPTIIDKSNTYGVS